MMATGLSLQFGGVEVTVDGEPRVTNEEFLYRGMMMSNVPNSFLCVGYTNASWTLRVDLLGNFVCDMLTHMKTKGFGYVCPRPPPDLTVGAPLLDLDSTYVKRHLKDMPKQGPGYPWATPGHYLGDYLDCKVKPLVHDSLHFEADCDGGLKSKL